MKVLLHLDELLSIASKLVSFLANFLYSIAFPSSSSSTMMMIGEWHDEDASMTDKNQHRWDDGMKKRKSISIEEYLVSQGYLNSNNYVTKDCNDEVQPDLKEERLVDDTLN